MKRGRKKVALESQFNKITGYLSDATSIVIERCDEPQLIVQTIVNDMLHKIGMVRCIDDWNRLPDCVVESDAVLSFKTQWDKFLSGRRFDLDQIY